MRRQTNSQPDLLAGRTLDAYCAGLGRLYAALADHTAVPVGGLPVLQNQAHAEGAAPGSQESARQVAGVERPAGSVAPSGQPCELDPIDAALRAEDDAEADDRLWDAVAVVAGVVALLAGAAVWFWLMGGLGR